MSDFENWLLDELQKKQRDWNVLFELCLEHKQWHLLEKYWEQIELERKQDE